LWECSWRSKIAIVDEGKEWDAPSRLLLYEQSIYITVVANKS
jgi:hypothetical protein